MGNGVAEIGHEAITHILSVVTFILFDDSFRDLMEIIYRVPQVFRVELLSENAGVYEITTHQRHLPTVRGGLGGNVGGMASTACKITRVGDAIGKPRRGGGGGKHRRGGAANIAKLVSGRNLGPAFRAIQPKQRT